MPANQKPATKAYAKTNKKPITKAANKKSKQEKKSTFLIVGIFLLLIIFVSGCFYFTYKKTNNSTKKTEKTIYIKADKKPESQKIEVYTEEEQKESSKNNEKKLSLDSHKSTETKTNSKPTIYPNKFVSPEREWQPINPGLREATNRFKNLVYGGEPKYLQELNTLENLSYYSAYSEKKKNPIWVAYRLDSFKGQNKLQRLTKFMTDLRTKSKVNQRIYSKTGYDKGHMCPNSAIAARYGKRGQAETFLMSNICPQKPDLNRKVWERLERLEEAYANKFGGIWVITGPIFDQHVELLGNQIEIPDAFFKILVDEDKGRMRVLPFIVPQNVTGKEILNSFLTSIDEIEKQTNLDFFTAMDDEYEKKLESYVPGKTMWN